MPTLNPRLTITLEPPVAACLKRLSEVTGNSQSKLIAELLEGSVPVFERVIATIQAAKSATAEIRGKLATDMEAAQGRVEQQLGFAYAEFDGATAPLLAGIETIKRRSRKSESVQEDGRRGPAPRGRAPVPSAASGRKAPEVTPPSNRGVRSTANPRKTTEKAKA